MLRGRLARDCHPSRCVLSGGFTRCTWGRIAGDRLQQPATSGQQSQMLPFSLVGTHILYTWESHGKVPFDPMTRTYVLGTSDRLGEGGEGGETRSRF